MLISFQRQAKTTPKIRATVLASDDPAWLVAECYGISEQTAWKWRKRDSVHDLSHTGPYLVVFETIRLMGFASGTALSAAEAGYCIECFEYLFLNA